MDEDGDMASRARRIALPGRGGEMAALEMGPRDRPVDVVFSHANGFNGQTYRSILAPAAKTLRILALDLRGHGASTLPTDQPVEPGWGMLRDDLLALLEAIAEQPVVLAGHSLGSTTSLLAAWADPTNVRSLALFDPVILPPPSHNDGPGYAEGAARRRPGFPSRAAAVKAYRGRGAFTTWSETQLADYVEAGFHDTADGAVALACAPAWEAQVFRTTPRGLAPRLVELQRPLHILRAPPGATTCMIPPMPGMETVPGTSHFLPMEAPERVSQLLLEVAA